MNKMKTHLRTLIVLIFYSIGTLSCIKNPCKILSLSKIYVETGVISKTLPITFGGARPFDPLDNALGVINSINDTLTCNTIPNGFRASDETIYVFEHGVIPTMNFNFSLAINRANWVKDYIYEIENDAMVCKKNMIFFTRQKEDKIIREKAIINGITVYRFKDELYEENYNLFQSYHSTLVSKSNNVNLFNSFKNKNPNNYLVLTGRSSLVFDKPSGYFNLDLSSETIVPNFDKVRFIPIGLGQKYIFRYLYKKYPTSELANYFIKNECINEAGWKQYLKEVIYTQYFPTFIEGYSSCKCDNNNTSRIASGAGTPGYSPPLPLINKLNT